jgi:L-alanine-DL-glutamate epimerase-like enolase superfamily enzyme
VFNVKITDIETRLLRYPLPKPFHPSWTPGAVRPYNDVVLVRVHTDEGITGVGAGIASYSRELEVAVEERIKPMLIGTDPMHIELIFGLLQGTTVMGHPHPWLIEIACWDILGKAAGLPVYRLLGGHHVKLPAYVSTGALRSVEERLDDLERFREMGFKAVKLRFHHADPREDFKVLEAVRKRFGHDFTIMVDVNQGRVHKGKDPTGGWTYPVALQVARELEQWDVYWMEEPLDMYNFEDLARLSVQVDIRIAGGELNGRMADFKTMLRLGSLDIYQPDAVYAGGILGLKKLAASIELNDRVFTPHTWSNGIGLAANLHVSASMLRPEFVEYPLELDSWTAEARDFMLTEPIGIDSEGNVLVPQGAGLGIQLDEEKIDNYTVLTK